MAKTIGAKGGGGRPSEKSQLAVKAGNNPPVMPSDLHGEYAIELWRLAVNGLPHVLREIDGPVLRLCCEAYQVAMDQRMLLIAEPDNSDALKGMIAAMTKFDSLAKTIGLNPHSRRVIKPADGNADNEKDPLTDWLARGGLN